MSQLQESTDGASQHSREVHHGVDIQSGRDADGNLVIIARRHGRLFGLDGKELKTVSTIIVKGSDDIIEIPPNLILKSE